MSTEWKVETATKNPSTEGDSLRSGQEPFAIIDHTYQVDTSFFPLLPPWTTCILPVPSSYPFVECVRSSFWVVAVMRAARPILSLMNQDARSREQLRVPSPWGPLYAPSDTPLLKSSPVLLMVGGQSYLLGPPAPSVLDADPTFTLSHQAATRTQSLLNRNSITTSTDHPSSEKFIRATTSYRLVPCSIHQHLGL